jgi:hypothetical protein
MEQSLIPTHNAIINRKAYQYHQQTILPISKLQMSLVVVLGLKLVGQYLYRQLFGQPLNQNMDLTAVPAANLITNRKHHKSNN